MEDRPKKLHIRRHGDVVQVIGFKRLEKENNNGLSVVRKIVAEFYGENAERWTEEFMKREVGR